MSIRWLYVFKEVSGDWTALPGRETPSIALFNDLFPPDLSHPFRLPVYSRAQLTWLWTTPLRIHVGWPVHLIYAHDYLPLSLSL